MPEVTANGFPVIACRLAFPRVGAWWADLSIASGDDLADGAAVTIEIANGPTLQGVTVPNRTRVFLDTLRCRVIGGKGGLSATSSSKFYQQIPARNIIADILTAGGESLAATSTASTLAAVLPFWAVGSLPVGAALATIMGYLGASWRVLPDGTVWVGVETWPTADPERVLLNDTPTEDRVEYGCTSPSMLPATVVDGRRVNRVEHLVEEDRVRSIAWLE